MPIGARWLEELAGERDARVQIGVYSSVRDTCMDSCPIGTGRAIPSVVLSKYCDLARALTE
jgi:hypothetical protein